jgi:hypothetical protein
MPYTPETTLIPRAKATLFALGVAALLAPLPAVAQDAPSVAKPICLDAHRIDHTEVLNNHQILFYMVGKEKGSKVWINNLAQRCPTLTRSDGFVWSDSEGTPKYCDNLEIIRVIQSGETCLLGAFTPYEKPPRAS